MNDQDGIPVASIEIAASGRDDPVITESARAGAPTKVPSRQHLPVLDGLRGVAILLVLVVHSIPPIRGKQAGIAIFNSAVHCGVFGVDLFFVLSGFLITGILLDSKGGCGYFKTFYIRRVLRLFPVYYGLLLIMMCVVPALHRAAHLTVPEFHGNWAWYLLYFSNWKLNHDSDASLGHFWSLALEEQFYLMWPVTVYLLPRRALVYWCGFLSIAAVVLRCIFVNTGIDIYANTPFRLDSPSIGALLALAVRSDVWRARLLRHRVILYWVTFGAFMAAILHNWRFPWNPISAFFAATWFGMLVFQGAAGASDSAWWRGLNRRFVLSYGRYSYCIYVLNLLFLDHGLWLSGYLRAHLPHMAGLLVTGMIMAAANAMLYFAARISWQYYEKPILALKNRIAPRITRA